jgi:hypothetical protein
MVQKRQTLPSSRGGRREREREREREKKNRKGEKRDVASAVEGDGWQQK